jgi:hypothetical protein
MGSLLSKEKKAISADVVICISENIKDLLYFYPQFSK